MLIYWIFKKQLDRIDDKLEQLEKLIEKYGSEKR